MINTLGHNIIFKDMEEEMETATFRFAGPYLFIYPNSEPQRIEEVSVELNKQGIAPMCEKLEELFRLRAMDGQVYDCIGPYMEEERKCYTVNVKSITENPVREGVLLERMDWERNKMIPEYDLEILENEVAEN